MLINKSYQNHYEKTVLVKAPIKEVFDFGDNHTNFSSHMNKSSLMMGGGKLETKLDSGKGQTVGSHIIMEGKVFGINLFLDEVVIKREPPKYKEWETVGSVRLLVIGNYRLGFNIKEKREVSEFTVYIDYDLPKGTYKLLGKMFGDIYARWCVKQMVKGVIEKFN